MINKYITQTRINLNLLNIVLMLIPSILFGQVTISEKDFNFYFTPSLGATTANYKNLNNELLKSGHKSFASFHYGVGLDLSLDYKKIGGFIHVFSSLGQRINNKHGYANLTDVLSTEIGLEYKFRLNAKGNYKLSIFASRGTMQATTQIEKIIGATNFNDALNNSGNITSIDQISDFWSGGIGVYLIRYPHLKYNLKLGYRFNEDQYWIPYTNDNVLANSPNDNLSGVFVNLGVNVNINIFLKTDKNE